MSNEKKKCLSNKINLRAAVIGGVGAWWENQRQMNKEIAALMSSIM